MESLDIGYNDDRFTTPVHQDLHCPICLNILKEPMQCQSNEHHFCTACISRHLENYQTCPSCMEELTLATLKKPSRFLSTNLSDLVIRCDYVDRGCPEVVVLADLTSHLVNCEFSPVQCSNDGCTKVVNKRKKIQHESQTCKFRKLRCDDCRETRKDNEEVKLRLGRLEDQISEVLTGINNITDAAKSRKMSSLPKATLQSKEDIIIVGGRNTSRFRSAEMFSWFNKAWVPIQPMKEVRSGPSSVVYEDKVIVTGGLCSDHQFSETMEALKFGDEAEEWLNIPPTLPLKVSAHKCLIYKDRLFLIGGYGDKEEQASDSIYEISVIPPYSSKLVHRLPEPVCYHGAERFDNNIFIVGGSTISKNEGPSTDQIIKYDINTHECIKMPALPFAVREMATTSWQNNVIVVGGKGVDGKILDTVAMYDVETGKSKMLPNMKYRRRACTAVVSNNMIVVMGGVNESKYLNTVECFSFDRYCWEELPPMIEARSFASAVIKCCNFY